MDAEAHDSPTCKNCGAPLTGEYCSKCGQRDYDFNRSFREIGADVAESFFNWDTKLVHAVHDLLFRPGMLTKSYLAGKRVSQVPPLRFYLFVSILFFLASSFAPKDVFRVDDKDENTRIESLPVDPATKARMKEAKEAHEAAKREHPEATEFQIEKFFQDRWSHKQEIEDLFYGFLPNMVFALLPVFALITRIVFRKAKLAYLSHLVVALHLHSFYFLFSLVTQGWEGLLGFVSPGLAGLVGFASFIYFVAYLFIAARRVFACSVWGTIWRAVVTGMLYSLSLGVGFVALLIVVLFMV